jgi:hypothetical protein
MKTDHFAEFRRRLHIEIAGSESNRVTNGVATPEKPGEPRSFSPRAAVTQIYDPWVTRVTGPGLDSDDVTRVTQAVRERVTVPEREKPAQNQGNPESVTRVTRVTQKSSDDGSATAAECRAAGPKPEKASPTPTSTCWPERLRPEFPLRRCGSLVCQTCHAHSPSSHCEGCISPRFDPCSSRWFWLSPYGAIKCVACAAPADLGLVEAWVLARETGEGGDGWRIPCEILSLLHVTSPPQ